MVVQVSSQDKDFISFGSIPRSRTAQSCGSCIFNLTRNHHTAF